MKTQQILLIGGTRFIGRHIVEKLSAHRGYTISLLNRGITHPDLYPYLTTFHADRNKDDLRSIIDKDWDYIIDVSCYFPHSIEHILSHAPSTLKKYIFISTCSVYAPSNKLLKEETDPILELQNNDVNDITLESYGIRKAHCEKLIKNSGINYSIFRPALVFGPYDHTDRFYYWIHQVATKKEIMIPNSGNQCISLSYVSDVAQSVATALSSSNDRQEYNCISFPEISIANIIQGTSKILNKTPRLVSASSSFLHAQKVKEWEDLPLWIDNNHSTFSNQKITEALSLSFTSFRSRLKEVISYYDRLNWPEPIYGISQQKQQQLLSELNRKVG